jgi:hypothetical protein
LDREPAVVGTDRDVAVGSGGEVQFIGVTEVEVFSVPSRTQPDPRVVLRLPLPGNQAVWICSCPAKLNPEFNHDCHHIRAAQRERKRGWATAK